MSVPGVPRALSGGPPDAITPSYDGGGLAGVLPAVLAALEGRAPSPGLLALAPAARSVVVLADGLGDVLLARRGGHAPFLRRLRSTGHRLTTGFPSTTATGMGTFGTGLPPGGHGLVGYEVLDPQAGRLFNELSWDNGPVPELWQRSSTVFEQAVSAGIDVTRIGPGFFDGSGLTRAALRGGRFLTAKSLADRVDAAVAAVRASRRALVYLYWGEVDKVGHVHGVDSWQWGAELESLDAEMARLARGVPSDTSVYLTADHGMVDAPFEGRIDLASDAELAGGIAIVGGEPRGRQLYCEPGSFEDVLATWRGRLGDRAWVLTRAEAVEAGWFGVTDPAILPRIGDIVAAMRGDLAVVDSRHERPELLALLGHHGSLTEAEMSIPLLVVPPRG